MGPSVTAGIVTFLYVARQPALLFGMRLLRVECCMCVLCRVPEVYSVTLEGRSSLRARKRKPGVSTGQISTKVKTGRRRVRDVVTGADNGEGAARKPSKP